MPCAPATLTTSPMRSHRYAILPATPQRLVLLCVPAPLAACPGNHAGAQTSLFGGNVDRGNNASACCMHCCIMALASSCDKGTVKFSRCCSLQACSVCCDVLHAVTAAHYSYLLVVCLVWLLLCNESACCY